MSRSPLGPKAVRYSAVSAVAVPLTQVLLIAGYHGFGWTAPAANVVAVSVASIPAFFLNRAWVWKRRGPSDFARELLPFWLMTLAGLALSTVFVVYAADASSSPLAVPAANIAGFGTVWVAKFAVLERFLFAEPAGAA